MVKGGFVVVNYRQAGTGSKRTASAQAGELPMRKRFNGRLRVVTCSLLVVMACAMVALASHSWGNYHWARTSNPFTLKLGDNVSSTWDPHLAETSRDWSQSSVLDTDVVAGAAKGRCRPTSGRVEVRSEEHTSELQSPTNLV